VVQQHSAGGLPTFDRNGNSKGSFRGEEVFEDLYGIAFNCKGESVVSRGAAGVIKVFDKDGSFLANTGELGEGPGQINHPNDDKPGLIA